MGKDKGDTISALNTSAKELQRGIEVHCCLLASIMMGHTDEHNLRPLLNAYPRPSPELMMKEAIKEAIDELEETRKSFKSKRLEALRKRLNQVLINAH